MKRLTLLFSIFAAICFAASGQNKTNYSPEVLELGDGKIISSKQNETNDFVLQEFKVEVQSTGEYYLTAWVNGGGDGKGKKPEYIIQINDDETEYKVDARENNPHAIDLGETRIFLKSGSNAIVFKTRKPTCPNVEFIKVSLNKEKSAISNKNYSTYIEELSRQKLPENYAAIKKAAQEAERAKAKLKSYKLANPEGNYEHEMDLDFGYAYYTYIYLSSGNTYIFETKNATSDPVLQLFKTDAPSQYSWTNDDGGEGYNSKLTVNITSTGNYYVFIRKYINPSSVVGTCDLYLDNSLYVSNCAVSGSGIRCDISVSETLNWFTASLSGDSRIWIEDQSDFPGRIIDYNDDYYSGSGDFYWGLASRVKANLNTSIRAVIVSCYSSYNPTGNCDLYMNCKNSTITSSFPNLEADDAVQSAPQSSAYNCISWSGGRTDLGRYFWPADYGNPWEAYNHVNYGDHDLRSFDNFYSNKDDDGNVLVRDYGSIMNITRSSATSSNASVALWGFGSEYYTHGSVKKPANDQPHGYDWESKPGGLMRTFHPRD
ncbi:MAG: hypothetical protein Q7W54_05970, partial [Bacteroidota bacterium]|nr:hypothetical protein [Bacteroidota bacterium]